MTPTTMPPGQVVCDPNHDEDISDDDGGGGGGSDRDDSDSSGGSDRDATTAPMMTATAMVQGVSGFPSF